MGIRLDAPCFYGMVFRKKCRGDPGIAPMDARLRFTPYRPRRNSGRSREESCEETTC